MLNVLFVAAADFWSDRIESCRWRQRERQLRGVLWVFIEYQGDERRREWGKTCHESVNVLI